MSDKTRKMAVVLVGLLSLAAVVVSGTSLSVSLSQGRTGPSGLSATGPTGMTGPEGLAGPTGLGMTGDMGPTGAPGAGGGTPVVLYFTTGWNGTTITDSAGFKKFPYGPSAIVGDVDIGSPAEFIFTATVQGMYLFTLAFYGSSPLTTPPSILYVIADGTPYFVTQVTSIYNGVSFRLTFGPMALAVGGTFIPQYQYAGSAAITNITMRIEGSLLFPLNIV